MRAASARRARRFLLGVLAIIGGVLVWRQVDRLDVASLAGAALFATGWLSLRMLFAVSARLVDVPSYVVRDLDELRVVAVVPFYNEDPEYFRRCLESIDAQTRPPQAVWLVDDCSPDARCLAIAREFAEQEHKFSVQVIRAPENAGKRHAQSYAFLGDRADIWLTLDSDTVLSPNAIEEGIKPFSSERVAAVAGLTLGRNWRRNWLTRIIDIEFANSFLIGRASASRFGAVTVACGTIAFYREAVVRPNLDDYLNETFLGRPVRAGDDRRLTQYALRLGRVVFQETAVAHTALPERFGHLVRQRLRWAGSFYRGVNWTVRNLGFRDIAYWFIVVQVVELVVVALLLVALLTYSLTTGITAFLVYVAYMGALAYVRAIRYIAFSRADMRLRDKLCSVALAPLISVLYIFVLNPLRYWAVTKVTDARWGTRRNVEVAIAPAE